MIVGCIAFLVLLVVALNFLSKSYEADLDNESLDKEFKDKLKTVRNQQNDCFVLIASNETNYRWFEAMIGAYNLDQTEAVRLIALAETAYSQNNTVTAFTHLKKAATWYAAYNARLQVIYGPEETVAPPVPVIEVEETVTT